MNILIDNKDLKTVYGIDVLDYTPALDFAAERENERIWADKSGVDKNLENVRYEAKEFYLKCYCKATNEAAAYELINILVEYMFTKGVFVLSLRDSTQGIRESFVCERSNTIVSSITVRQQNSLYEFKLGLKDINPNAIKYQTTIVGNAVTIDYTKGQTAVIYWGNGDQDTVSNSGDYTKDDYSADGDVDIIIDLDKDVDTVIPLEAEFSADITTGGVKPQTVQFTDLSTGTVEIYSWDFGDGNTSDEANPSHIYTEEGVYTVTLQIFNSARGYDTETKINYITVRNSRLLINDSGDTFLINYLGDEILKN